MFNSITIHRNRLNTIKLKYLTGDIVRFPKPENPKVKNEYLWLLLELSDEGEDDSREIALSSLRN